MEVPSRFEIDDVLWAEVEPLIPVRRRRRRYPGRKALPDRVVLNGILHVLHTGIAWEDLPQEFGYGSGVTCWRRLRDWQEAEVWEGLHQAAGQAQRRRCDRLVARGRRRIPCSRHFGGLLTGPPRSIVAARAQTPRPDRRHRHAAGLSLTGGNRNDVTQLMPLVDEPGRPVRQARPAAQKPDRLLADRGYDHDKYRRLLRARGISQ